LKIKIKRLEKENEEITRRIVITKERIRAQQELNDKLDDKIQELKQELNEKLKNNEI
jgi:archaellum component FlaC